MELTIEQALQQGVAAHNSGNLQEAERVYQAILHSHPKHPDANHNLGLIAISVNQIEVALPLFQTALYVNPMIEQFWVSYIDVLVKNNQLKEAKKVIKKAKNRGFDAKKLEAPLSQSKGATDTKGPSEAKLSFLLEHYQKGRYSEAEKLATSISREFQSHNFSWKILAAVFRVTGRNSEAEFAGKKAVKINPEDVEAHTNFGNMLQELGRLDEAEASYRQAILLKPSLAEAHHNLGTILLELGRLGEAEGSYRQTIALNPDYAEAHSNLGGLLKELGRLDEAEASCRQAVALKPDFVEAHNNLGVILKNLGRLDEAEASYKQVIALKPDCAEAHNSLLTCLYLLDKKSDFFDELDHLINQDKTNALIGSLTCRAALKYGLEKPNLFCREPLKYVLHTDLNARYDFEEIFVKKTKSILNENQIPNRRQALLVNGYQTSGNLFDIKNDFTNEIQKAIRFEIEKYRINFKNSEEGLIKKWPTEYSLYGWLISMKSGGELQPHIHNQGWLSGSIYINIPKKSKADSGNLVVSLGQEKDAIDTRINVKKIINVVTGSMVLFPASLTHHTIPFESEEARIVLAFDVKRK